MASITDTHEPARRSGRGARQRILNAATDLFYREGINATGVERLADEAAVSKRISTNTFRAKQPSSRSI